MTAEQAVEEIKKILYTEENAMKALIKIGQVIDRLMIESSIHL